jgi:AraC-like DNA-binding protein
MINKIKLKILIIEIGIKNIEKIKELVFHKNIEFIYASSFLDVVDILHLDNVHIIVFSDFRKVKSTIGYIKMFRTTNPDFKLIILSNDKKISEDYKNYFIQRGIISVFSCYDIASINNTFNDYYEKIINYNQIKSEWSNCTKKAIRFLKNNYHISSKLLDEISKNIDYSISSIVHLVKKDTGISISNWIQKLRINGAIELLKSTDYPLKYISNQVGYKSIQGFIKAFKKLTQDTPSNFRKKYE